MSAREDHLVELVDPAGKAIGSATVRDAHLAPGQLHRAFSVVLLDAAGRALLQQRAAVKTRFPLRWANTCCGHPLPGEDLTVAATRRLAEELGLAEVPLTDVGVYAYYAEDPVSGRVEYEYDHVLVGTLPAGWRPDPDPAEVAGVRWQSVPELLEDLERDPRSYAPWLSGVALRLGEHLAREASSRGPGRVPRQLRGAPDEPATTAGLPGPRFGNGSSDTGAPVAGSDGAAVSSDGAAVSSNAAASSDGAAVGSDGAAGSDRAAVGSDGAAGSDRAAVGSDGAAVGSVVGGREGPSRRSARRSDESAERSGGR